MGNMLEKRVGKDEFRMKCRRVDELRKSGKISRRKARKLKDGLAFCYKQPFNTMNLYVALEVVTGVGSAGTLLYTVGYLCYSGLIEYFSK